MGQDDVYKILKKNGKWMTCKEINKTLKQSASSLNTCLRRLEIYRDIVCDRSNYAPFKYKVAI